MKPMTEIVLHSVIVLLMDEIMVKNKIPLFAGHPLEPPQDSWGHFESIFIFII